ncbi:MULTISPECIES: FhaA domain-containing protein [unclassified Selenomonas]|uniref:FhaA domain-containing protein n=1 Tax=unclassified Selenomonas TaxID=2637378 RepID=UPI00051BD13D|nr:MULTISPECIES: FhaA domain-containing protein [unclassified Selenomonas]MCR5438253.1 DUF3662 and FHA domain-containing protein [Selenomonas sp.]
MGIGKLESFLEGHIEGFFNKRFSSDLELAELMKGLEKEIGRQGRGKAMHLVPNRYVFTLAEDDYQRFCAQRVIDELYVAVEKQVILQNYRMEGKLQVQCQKEADRIKGTYALTSRYEDDGPSGNNEVSSQTIVLRRPGLSASTPLNLPQEHKVVSLTVIEGADLDAYLEFGEKQIYIGRRDKNEFILTDVNASRLHAWITYEDHRHILHDAQSTNGTYVNGRRIDAHCLVPGDEIQIGATVLVYEVI